MLDNAALNGLVKLLLPDLNAVIQQNQDAHSPEKPYCAWRITSEIEIGLAAKGEKDAPNPLDLIQYIERSKRATIEFNFYTETESRGAEKVARKFCNEFLNKLNLQSSSEYFRANNMALVDHNDFQNIDQHLGDNWERRAVCELVINYVDSVEEEITTIQYNPATDAGIVGTFINHDGTEL
jgi:hypothetical protein